MVTCMCFDEMQYTLNYSSRNSYSYAQVINPNVLCLISQNQPTIFCPFRSFCLPVFYLGEENVPFSIYIYDIDGLVMNIVVGRIILRSLNRTAKELNTCLLGRSSYKLLKVEITSSPFVVVPLFQSHNLVGEHCM